MAVSTSRKSHWSFWQMTGPRLSGDSISLPLRHTVTGTVSLRGGPPFLNRLDRRGLDFDFRRGDEKCPQVWLWAQVCESGGVTGHGLRL